LEAHTKTTAAPTRRRRREKATRPAREGRRKSRQTARKPKREGGREAAQKKGRAEWNFGVMEQGRYPAGRGITLVWEAATPDGPKGGRKRDIHRHAVCLKIHARGSPSHLS